MNRLCGSVAVAALVLGLAANAQAGKPKKISDEDRAKQQASIALAKESLVLYNLGRFDETIERLERAYILWNYPDLLYDLAQVHRIKKNFDKAVGYYKAFLRDPGDSVNRESAEAWLVEMEALVKRLGRFTYNDEFLDEL